MAWTDEDKATAIKMYTDAEPTAQNSAEIVKQIAEHFTTSVNGVRMILTKAEVYIKIDKTAGAAKATTADGKEAPKRVSKADAIEELNAAISDAGQEADDEIIAKLTGKAALYFAGVIRGIAA